MTQILAALTPDFVVVASDRKLTYIAGPWKHIKNDTEACKLVSLCNLAGIAYSGWAELDSAPTHEWIASRLAAQNCVDPGVAADILCKAAYDALRNVTLIIPQTFLIAGWGLLKTSTGEVLTPHFRLITNTHAADRTRKAVLDYNFTHIDSRVAVGQSVELLDIGQPLKHGRKRDLRRHLKRLVAHELGPKAALQALVDEIVVTSKRFSTVGNRILGFCIPRAAAERVIATGHTTMLAQIPDMQTAAFCYFHPTYSTLRQYGPTFTCAGSAITNLVTEDDPARQFQSAQFKILHMPAASSAQ